MPFISMFSISDFLIGIIVIVALFLIFRAFVLWYWGISKIIRLLEEIADNLKKKSKEEEK